MLVSRSHHSCACVFLHESNLVNTDSVMLFLIFITIQVFIASDMDRQMVSILSIICRQIVARS